MTNQSSNGTTLHSNGTRPQAKHRKGSGKRSKRSLKRERQKATRRVAPWVAQKIAQQFNDLFGELQDNRVPNAKLWISDNPRIYFPDQSYISQDVMGGFTARPDTLAHSALEALGYPRRSVHPSVFI
jgi:hypothetical protein